MVSWTIAYGEVVFHSHSSNDLMPVKFIMNNEHRLRTVWGTKNHPHFKSQRASCGKPFSILVLAWRAHWLCVALLASTIHDCMLGKDAVILKMGVIGFCN